ncbi:hypothetical protein CICLE_v10022583mg [Citrus x clementina]|uniref:Importin subunit alpha-4 n=2 Tax=Citrus TaxID=2706 RepID=A0ACB8MG07_CITSI|nr:hypothetical protein CICLE_v10022583mg [Citrus x clementina]KAH9784568.1 Importin subunit alpha-4 [Citrus sinensis]
MNTIACSSFLFLNVTSSIAVMEANIILPYPSFCAPLLQHAELEIKEAAWPVLNATYGGSHEHIQFLVSQGCIKPLCDLLGLENIFKVGEVNKEIGMDNWVNVYTQMIDECDGVEKIENLHIHDNNEIYEWVVKEEEGERLIQDGGIGNQQQGLGFATNQPNIPIVV